MNACALVSRIRKSLPPEIRDAAVEIVVSLAAGRYPELVTGEQRREYAVRTLMQRFGLHESVARLAVELAVQVYKDRSRS